MGLPVIGDRAPRLGAADGAAPVSGPAWAGRAGPGGPCSAVRPGAAGDPPAGGVACAAGEATAAAPADAAVAVEAEAAGVWGARAVACL
jgi:hypothetical protein